jgi:hypothetical protein
VGAGPARAARDQACALLHWLASMAVIVARDTRGAGRLLANTGQPQELPMDSHRLAHSIATLATFADSLALALEDAHDQPEQGWDLLHAILDALRALADAYGNSSDITNIL